MKRKVLSTKLHVGDASVRLYFSFDGPRIVSLIQRNHKKLWELDYKNHLGETTGTTLLEGLGKGFVAVWVNREEHKNDLETLLTINHECGHAAREMLRIYNEEQTAEETAIRVEDAIRRKIYNFLKIEVELGYGKEETKLLGKI